MDCREDLEISALRKRFQTIVNEHYEGLWSYVGCLTGRSADTEDLVHDAFLVAFDRLARGEEFRGDPGRWLRGTARNLVYEWWRERRKLPQRVVENLKLLAEDGEPRSAAPTATEAERQAALTRCLERLDSGARQLVAKRYEDGSRMSQIAEEMQRNVATLRVRLFRIRRRLKDCVERQLSSGSAI